MILVEFRFMFILTIVSYQDIVHEYHLLRHNGRVDTLEHAKLALSGLSSHDIKFFETQRNCNAKEIPEMYSRKHVNFPPKHKFDPTRYLE